jgi:hypothetical protein
MERYSDAPLPKSAYIPGQTGRPTEAELRALLGDDHFGIFSPATGACDPRHRVAIDLFNAGFYWEAHEAWERVWVSCGRRGAVADVVKGLVKLAAAGVKNAQGNPIGSTRHARRAAELIAQTRGTLGPVMAGVELTRVESIARQTIIAGWDTKARIDLEA